MQLSRRSSAIFAAASALVAVSMPQAAIGQPAAFRTPQFTASAISFKALHETHANWLGSDEVYALIYDFPRVTLRRTTTFGDVDAGESRSFAAGDSCISPLPTCQRGASSLSFGVALYEQDQPPFQFCHGALDSTPPSPADYERRFDALDANCDDDLIGKAKIMFSQPELVALLPTVGASFEKTVGLTGGDGRYELTYRVTRLANVIDVPEIGPAVLVNAITLQAMAVAGQQVHLTWAGATTANVDIFRNGVKVTTTPNDGDYLTPSIPAGTYQYRVCEANSTTACSADVAVVVT
jgi:hypothetical protein